ncbi:unnamed protein product [Thelazia callipaeda]|uniref:Transthyretin-like family protein n=1 Tax=Thelazia callipaeda TaxID=103827 RepID=A0A0N5D1G4_THECL|nr:unnamed protein product [Thelazia callipaeda]
MSLNVVFAFVNRNQSVEIRGKFICGSEVIHRAAVEVWKDDKSVWKSAFYILMQKRDSMDTYLARTNTNEFGEFVIAATYQQHLVIKPYLYVYHRCEIEKYSISEYRPEFKLWRTFVIKVPERYVNTGNRALRVLDLGVYNLQFQFLVKFSDTKEHQLRDCCITKLTIDN